MGRESNIFNDCERRLNPDENALIEILKLQYERFTRHFGRDPEVDEPLFFDANVGAPVPLDPEGTRTLVIAVAMAANVDYRPVLRMMGLNQA
ncbi:MAG TPA: hypothetical protein VEC38_07275 [Candidatus Binataceae bacterium]|nr:hypothetical protein [Candidatus Binataceae bacterium]